MKTIILQNRIFAVLLCVMMTISLLPTSVFAAKEMFSEITSAGVTGIDAPVAGQTGDYTANVVNTGKYTVEKIDYYESAGDRLKPQSEAFKYDTEYYVLISLKTKSAYYFAYDGSTGNPKISATCNGAAAQAVDLGPDADSTMFGIKYTFPKTEKQNPNIIYAVNLTGLDLPSHYSKADTSVSADDYRVSTEVVWKNQDGSAFSGVFEYGKSYTAMIYLFINNNCDFAKDYTHPLATADRPMPAVTVTLDGEPITVMPDYTRNQFMRCLAASKVYKCEGKMTLNSIILSDVTVPSAGGAVNYNFTCNQHGYERLDSMNDSTYYKGVAWRVDGGVYLETSKGTFDANESYQIVIRLKPKEGFSFAADGNGNTRMTATVNGKNAEVKSSKTEAIVTYTFPKTGSAILDKVEIGGVDIPEAGKSPDYTASCGANYGAADYNDKSTKNGISWYNETDKKTMSTTDKFEEGKTYAVQIMLWAEDGYEFRYQSGQVNITAAVNGQNAEVSSRSNEEVTVSYTFPKIAEHKHAPLKVDEFKATCREEGKKAYYFCPECGQNFEDSKCTRAIPDINAWGSIAKTEHTGGKATCDNRAICKNCGEYYGEFAAHAFGTAWDYRDTSGHAHKCKVCGINDTIISHSGGTATCGEMAKCAACGAEYGEVMQHQWSSQTDYTDKNGHAHRCTVCGEHDTIVKHTPGAAATETSSQNCTVCNYIIAPAKTHEHKLTKVPAAAAGCTTAGKEQHYVCDGCSKIFSDSKGNKEITDADSLIIPAVGHKESKWKSDADAHWKECTVKGCGAITAEKEAHTAGTNGKCAVCGCKMKETGAPAVTTAPSEEQTAAAPGTADAADAPDDGTVTAPDTTAASIPDSGSAASTAMLIAVIASGVIAAACIVVVIVVIAKKKK